MNENAVGERIIGCAIRVHKALGPGLLESAYEACLEHELRKNALNCRRQVGLPLSYDGLVLDTGYRLDMLVENLVVVEVKSVETVSPLHKAQVLSYLRLGGFRLGYVMNFNVVQLKDGISRIVNQL
jgi:GxxExxY protein